jgi:nitrite reductase (cytochrome c-552)
MTPAQTDVPRPTAARRRWVGPVAFGLAAAVVALLGLLAVSILEHRWEARRVAVAIVPLPEWESDPAAWGLNYPREYETYLKSRQSDTRTLYGGAFPRDYLDADPNLVVLWAGYGFAKDYKQARGHPHSVEDILATKRITPKTVGTCWTCKSADVPRLLHEMGPADFYAANFHDLRDEIRHPIACRDCHDPETLELVITRPALREGLKALGRDPDALSHQEMRSMVCAQCHSEYYFKDGSYLVFPWAKGTRPEEMLAYYDAYDFADFTHAISGTRVVKAQHPDWELWRTGIHAYRNVSCADCHMPYVSEGGAKYTDHHIQSPLLTVSRSCTVCHRWTEAEIVARVESAQKTVHAARLRAEEALVKAHFDVAAAAQTGAEADALAEVRGLVRRAQFRWDYVLSSNGMGIHSPQEATRILGEAADLAQQARVRAARLLARKGVTDPPAYPDVSTREKADAVMQAFVGGEPPDLLP